MAGILPPFGAGTGMLAFEPPSIDPREVLMRQLTDPRSPLFGMNPLWAQAPALPRGGRTFDQPPSFAAAQPWLPGDAGAQPSGEPAVAQASVQKAQESASGSASGSATARTASRQTAPAQAASAPAGSESLWSNFFGGLGNGIAAHPATLMALGGGIAQHGIGKGLEAASAAALKETAQAAKRSNAKQLFDALVKRGISPVVAATVAQGDNADLLKAALGLPSAKT